MADSSETTSAPITSPRKRVTAENSVESAVPVVPVLSYDEFVVRTGVSAVWAEGLQLYLASQGSLSPRSLQDWQQALVMFQALA